MYSGITDLVPYSLTPFKVRETVLGLPFMNSILQFAQKILEKLVRNIHSRRSRRSSKQEPCATAGMTVESTVSTIHCHCHLINGLRLPRNPLTSSFPSTSLLWALVTSSLCRNLFCENPDDGGVKG